MSDIDRQRISGVKPLEHLGYVFQSGQWQAPAAAAGEAFTAEADAMHALLITRADALEGCTENSPEAAERLVLTQAFEAKRWPDGREPRGEG